MTPYLLVSDFDQTLSFNDSGRLLSELLGISGSTSASRGCWSVLVPVLEEIAGYGTPEIRALFDRHGFVIQEWEKVRTDWLTVRDHGVAEHEPPMAVVA
jgi:hypothetical protein